ncbi:MULTISPECIES: protein-glutamate O-methyltransferase CheR [unclassified Acidocella]|uniref:CheR family methyltransferase n=1 Tax=unclassified Acidocella TaxID=2648610 RepID=UPI00028E0CCA|nr:MULTISPECIES: protein-glutamate O-methyltransferase [unclassified Acidocella]EKN00126.1 chemotaxis protein methyltransferase [Acidocella sp. MX-AZ02]WBO59695.1 protein-glutamate O-methyltransferase [Acidocella sp. MX-AZ03]
MAQLTATAKVLVENSEFRFTAADLELISRLMMQETGITLSTAKANLVYSRLAKRVRKLGLPGFAEYCALVEAPEGKQERRELVAALTTNVTRFFREPHHFEHMRTKMLPGLIRRARAGEKIRLWSAACSSGPEPYSMALTLLQEMPDAPRFDIRILASDIDQNVLATAMAGIYEDSQLEPVPPALRQAWFKPVSNGREHYQAAPELRQLISFKPLNLIGQWPMKGKFQIIFCRNVVIYFDNPTQERIWSRFTPLLEDAGALYIGHSERVSGAAEQLLVSDGVTIYRKRAGGART